MSMTSKNLSTYKCSLCHAPIMPKEEGSVIDMRWKFYENYTRDRGDPSHRRKLMLCPVHTRLFSDWVRENMDD